MSVHFPTKSDFAYEQVREKILSGEYAPGQVINQASLAITIGISTTPLREALRRLKSEGLVDLDAHRDARVTELTAEEARDLLEMRTSLDPLAAALAAERRSTGDVRAMREALADLRPLPDDPDLDDLVAHRRFHVAVYTASRNDILIRTLDSLWDKADRYRRAGLRGQREQAELDRTAAEHRALLERIADRDAEGAASVMRQHVHTSLGAKAAARLATPEPEG